MSKASFATCSRSVDPPGGWKAFGFVQRLPRNLPATICVVLHRSPSDATFLAPILARSSTLPIIEPRDGEPVEGSRIYLAPRDFI